MKPDSFRDYLDQIGRHPLLTAAQEIDLSRKVQRMLELQASTEPLTRTERRELLIGKRAQDQMVTCNLRLVVNVAKRYARRVQSLGLDDLIQEGSAVLPHAVQKFDGSRGYKFSTYAYRWIMQAVTRAIENQERMIRIPVGQEERLRRAKWVTAEYLQTHGVMPSTEWVARKVKVSVKELQMIADRAASMCSLDVPVVSDGAPLGELIAAPDVDNPQQNDEWHQMVELLQWVEPRQREMVELRYGIKTGEMKTLAAVGEEFGVTRERVRQLIGKAEDRMRCMARQSHPQSGNPPC